MSTQLLRFLLGLSSLLLLPSLLLAQIESDLEYEDFTPPLENALGGDAIPKGMYVNFNQLKNKTPLNMPNYTVRQRREFWGYSYLIFLENTKKRENKAFAYSDGTNLFINARNFRAGNYFVKVAHYGRFNFFKAWMMRRGMGVGIGIGPVVVGNNGGQLYAMVLDMHNGEIIRLTPRKMKMLLNSYPELLRSYEKEKQRNQPGVIEAYIVALNKLL